MGLPARGVAPTPDPPLSHPTPGRAARKLCASGSRWCPWPPCGSPAFCGSMCPGSGSTSSTPSPSQGPSPTTRSSAPTEVRQPFLCRGWGRVGLVGPAPPCAFLRRDPAQQISLHRRPGGDPATERVGAPLQQVRRLQRPLLQAGQRRRAGEGCLLDPMLSSPRSGAAWKRFVAGGSPLQPCLPGASSQTLPGTGDRSLAKENMRFPHSLLWGCRLQGGPVDVSSPPRASLGAINTCCLGPSRSSC